MSSVYIQEPPTSGKVILKTNYGDIEIELWANETPRTCRNFVQLCLEGYYDNTIFHRIIPGFMVQGGDPTGTGKGGRSIYGAPFMDELHSRLKFSHRGIVAMANESTPNTNQSQFFMTVDSCPWLDRKHTIFGKVEGNTLYNLLRINELEVDKASDRPICSPTPTIQRIEVTSNPYDDIIPRNLTIKDKYQGEKVVNESSTSQSQITHKKEKPEEKFQKPQAIKNKNLLSFQEDDDQENELDSLNQPSTSKFKKVKIKSSHDVLTNDPMLSKDQAVSKKDIEEQLKKKDEQQKAKDDFLQNLKQGTQQSEEEVKIGQTKIQQRPVKRQKVDIDKEIAKLERQERSRSNSKESSPIRRALKRVEKKKRVQKFATKYKGSESNSEKSEESDFSDGGLEFKKPSAQETQRMALEKTREQYNNLKAELIQFKKNKIGSLLDEQNLEVQTKVSALDLQRQKYLKKMKNSQNRQNETISMLNDFTSKLKSKYTKQDTQNWMSNKLKFHIDSQRAYDVNQASSNLSAKGTGANYENFLTGGDPNKKYQNSYGNVKRPDLGEDVVQGMNVEDIVSMNELIQLAVKNKIEGKKE